MLPLSRTESRATVVARSSTSTVGRVPAPAVAGLIFTLLFASSPGTAFAADPASVPQPGAGLPRVTGTVVAAGTGVPLRDVLVELDERGRRTSTDNRGRFDLASLPGDVGEVTLRFSRLGFAPVILPVSLAPDETVHLEVAMERQAIALDPIAVLLERTRMVGDPMLTAGIPGSAFHLGRGDLEAQKLAFDNVHDVLRQVPGVHVVDEEGYGARPHIGLRGAGSERSSNVTLMEDGVLIAPAPYAAPAAYYFPSTGRMDGVEIRKGASQIRYGPRTLGGAVNLISAPIPDRRDWMVELGGGQDAMLKAHARVGDSSLRTGWLVEGYTLRTDGFKELQGGGDTGFDTRDLLGKLRLNTDPSAPRYQELQLKIGYTDHVADETYLGLTDADFRTNGLVRYAASQNDALDTGHRQYQARYFIQPGPRTDLVLTAYRNDFARNWYKLQSVEGKSLGSLLDDPQESAALLEILRGGDSDPDALRIRANSRDYSSQGVQALFGLSLGGEAPVGHNIELGLRVHRDYEDRLQWEDGYAMAGGRMIRTSEGVPGSQENRLGEARALAVHLQDEVRAGRWSLVPGIRFESIGFTRTDWERTDPDRTGSFQVGENSVSVLIPGVGASYEWSPWTTFFAGVHRGFGPPGPGANQETKAEESVNYEAGFRGRWAGIGANLTGFLSDYSNILGQETLATGGTGTGDMYNGGAVRVLGLEAGVDADLARYVESPVGLPVRASYTLNQGTFRSSFRSNYAPWGTVESGDRLPYLPEHLWSGSVGVKDPGWELTLAWSGNSTMRTEAGRGPLPEGSGVDAFHIFTLSGEIQVGARAAIYAAAQNLTDARYVVSRRPAGVRPGLPRTLFMGVRIVR